MKAYLVKITATTRIVVDSDENPNNNDDLFRKCAQAARDKMIAYGIEDYLCDENAEITEDTEMPYDEDYDENGKYAVNA